MDTMLDIDDHQDQETALRRKSLQNLKKAIALKDTDRRISDLLADFSSGFAKGWKMAVGTCFRDSLDIKRIPIQGKKTATWTQGGMFSFSPGDIIYDTPDAYNMWEKGVKKIDMAFQVTDAIASRPKKELIIYRKISTYAGSLQDKKGKGDIERRKNVFNVVPDDWIEVNLLKKLVMHKTNVGVSDELLDKLYKIGALEKKIEIVSKRFPGSIKFNIMKSDKSKKLLCAEKRVSVSQDDFIKILIAGINEGA